MSLLPMYPPQKDSPSTFLQGDISATDTLILVGNSAVLPQVVPYPLTLGIDKANTETVMVTAIGDGNNQLTITRTAGQALAWPTGTKCARVFTSQDLSAVQNNITSVNEVAIDATEQLQLVTEMAQKTANVVGDDTFGLVKELNDEITTRGQADQNETNRATAAEEYLDYLKINRSELPQIIVDWTYNPAPEEFTLTITRYNASTQVTSTYTKNFPLITPDDAGLMTPEAYNEILALRDAVTALQQQGGLFIGVSFATKADLDAYVIPPTVHIGDFTYVLDDETQDEATTRYIYDGTSFEFAYVLEADPVGIATPDKAGLILSDIGTTPGKVFIESNGLGSVVGWDNLVSAVSSIVSANNPKIELFQNSISLGSFTLNQSTSSNISIPTPGDGAITLRYDDGTTIGTFSMNQDNSQVITIPKPSASGVVVSPTAPSNTAVLWVDTSSGVGMGKYWDTTSSTWKPLINPWGA